MRKIFQYLLSTPLTIFGNYLSAAPKRDAVSKSLSNLFNSGLQEKSDDCIVIDIENTNGKFIVFSDQHKGDRSWADDFAKSEKCYISALTHYYTEGFNFINLGDSEELWKFRFGEIVKHNGATFTAEAAFHPSRYYKTYGNHDVLWKNKLDVSLLLKPFFRMPLPVNEGIILKLKTNEQELNIFLTHGHQGDAMSDNNRINTWLVAHIWMPLQRYLRLNINAPSNDYSLRNKHNQVMHEWSNSQQNLILITGHTHQPVFASGKYFDHPNNDIHNKDKKNDNIRPCYFNTGCCCFSDGDITGIEIQNNFIKLVKWKYRNDNAQKTVLEEISFSKLIRDLGTTSAISMPKSE